MTALLPLLNGAAAKDAILIDPEILLASGIGDEFAAPPVSKDQGLLPCFKGEPGSSDRRASRMGCNTGAVIRALAVDGHMLGKDSHHAGEASLGKK